MKILNNKMENSVIFEAESGIEYGIENLLVENNDS